MERAIASDAELIEASRRGERAAFGALVERYASMVEAVSYAGTRDRALVEDIAQDTFVAAWRDLDRLRDAGAVRPWLCGIARNLARKARRRRGREVAAAEPDAIVEHTPFDVLRDDEAERLVASALARVPEVHREALVMFYYEQRSTKDVADALGISEEAVHQRLSRGRRYLAADLERSVERVLEGQRSRRDLAACVLGALPVALVAAPSRVDASTKGSNMWKLGALGIAATTIAVGTVAAWPHSGASSDARAARTGDVAHHGGALAVAGQGPAPALPGRGAMPATANGRTLAADRTVDCAVAARHLVDLAMASSPPPANVSPENIETTARLIAPQFEQLCHEAAWPASTLACVMGADDMWNAMMCKGAMAVPVPTALAPAGADISCAAVAAHSLDLVANSFDGLIPANQRAAIDTQRPQILAMLEATCTREAWSETQRRCAIAATSPLTLGACTQAATPPPPTPVPAGVDASCTAVGHHVAALLAQPIADTELPGLPDEARAALAANQADMPSQIETACTNGHWSDATRRCMLACTTPDVLAACQPQP